MTTLEKIRAEIDGIEINGHIRDVECFRAGINTALNVIDKYAEQEPTGHWIRQDNTKEPLYGWYFCSECNSVIGDKTKFCSNCGARMVEPQERSDKE